MIYVCWINRNYERLKLNLKERMISVQAMHVQNVPLEIPNTYGELAYVDSGRRPEYVRLIR